MVSQASRLNRLPAAERGITIGDFLVPVTIGERMSSRVRHVALIVAGALLIALSANVTIPVPGSPVPITGQTFSVLLVGGALGARRGVLATLLYLVMGLFLPVYADHKQGIAILGTVERRSRRPRRDRRLPHRVRPGQRARRAAGRARLGPPVRRRVRNDGPRRPGDLPDRGPVAHGRDGDGLPDGARQGRLARSCWAT